ncbi:ABC transporter [Mycolicibacterium duvalii]|uniref:ABC transporter ATP-binding protein n=1 Tax=Mycolicibacterium duvalii TaxID=39688 RepID=A0A7I7K9H1_9MYCO|nr:ABC transporter ATP-binding protein [Mycolicibacterium duvalii]MCV7371039.1 ABC transporter ATP-binding protein [Mycolicibacterium duvalii]PEG37126.1 ABC transporter [Mycolicibacterium duvalii]BBX20032.1 ABC transporter ATP-binding protein [Mycolicibacterium duvalii]
MSQTETALAFNDVSVVRGGRTVWSEATFDIPAGAVVAVIGTNGSGKTTLLQVVLGLMPCATGRVEVFGQPPGTANDQIGYVPQNYAATVGEAIRARDAVMLGLNGHRWGFGRTSRADRRRVDEALEAVAATAFADRRLSQLSGGQRQRVALAEALVGHPRMVILDEPLASLDLKSQQELVSLVQRVNRDFDVTVLLVAHDLNPLLPILTGAVYLLDGHAHYDSVEGVVDATLLTHLYGTQVDVVHTPQGELYVRRSS